jgi:hypothetical protein
MDSAGAVEDQPVAGHIGGCDKGELLLDGGERVGDRNPRKTTMSPTWNWVTNPLAAENCTTRLPVTGSSLVSTETLGTSPVFSTRVAGAGVNRPAPVLIKITLDAQAAGRTHDDGAVKHQRAVIAPQLHPRIEAHRIANPPPPHPQGAAPGLGHGPRAGR